MCDRTYLLTYLLTVSSVPNVCYSAVRAKPVSVRRAVLRRHADRHEAVPMCRLVSGH